MTINIAPIPVARFDDEKFLSSALVATDRQNWREPARETRLENGCSILVWVAGVLNLNVVTSEHQFIWLYLPIFKRGVLSSNLGGLKCDFRWLFFHVMRFVNWMSLVQSRHRAPLPRSFQQRPA